MSEENSIITSSFLEVLHFTKVLERDSLKKLNQEPLNQSPLKSFQAQTEDSPSGEVVPPLPLYLHLPACGSPRNTTENMVPSLSTESAFED